MNWYLAKMIFAVNTGGENQVPEFDIQMRLINSANQQEALMKSLALGEEEEEIFFSEIGDLVRRSFVDVAELTLLPILHDDMQLYAQSRSKEKRWSWQSYFFLFLQLFF